MLGWRGVGVLVWIFFLSIFAGGGILLARVLRGQSSGGRSPGGHSGALQILEEGYARGEIDREEFEERRKLLRS